MRLSSTALLLLFSFLLSAQATYKCTYADTLTIRMPADALSNMTLNIGGNLPDSLKAQVESMVRKQFSMKPIVQLLDRRVVATGDSTTVELKQGKVVSRGVRVPLPYERMVLKGGKLNRIYGRDSTGIDLPPGEVRLFRATGAGQTILDYECSEYKSGLVTIWVTSALPSSINPGIKNVDVPGAILGFSMEGDNTVWVSKILSIHQAN